jgi:Fe2+ or Zn2+ uptake regulation protein
MTLRQMSKKSKISLDTVRKTINLLKEANFIQPINVGAYQVNPDVIFKGNHGKRLNVLYQYHQLHRPKQGLIAETEAGED